MTKVIIIDDSRVFRSLLKTYLFDCGIVGETVNIPAALDLIENKKPDLVILVPTPFYPGLSVIPQIISRHATVKILVLTEHNEAKIAHVAFQMGASGYCLKDEGMRAIRHAIASIMRGENYLSPCLITA